MTNDSVAQLAAVIAVGLMSSGHRDNVPQTAVKIAKELLLEVNKKETVK